MCRERRLHGRCVNFRQSPASAHRRRRVVAQLSGVRLPELLAAPMPVQVAIRADIDDDVERIGPPRNPRSKSSRLVRELSATSITSLRARRAPAARRFVQLAERPIASPDKAASPRYPRAYRWAAANRLGQAPARRAQPGRQILLRPDGQILRATAPRAHPDRRGARAWAPAARRPHLRPSTQAGGAAHGCRDLIRQLAHFRDIRDDFSRRICCSSVRMLVTCPTPVGMPEKQAVARHIERPRGDIALVGVGLHVVRPRQLLAQRTRPCVRGSCDTPAAARCAGAPIHRGSSSMPNSGGVTNPEREKS